MRVKTVYCPKCGGHFVEEAESMLQYMEDWIYECPICESRYVVYFKPTEDDPDVMEPLALAKLDMSKEDLDEVIEFFKEAFQKISKAENEEDDEK